MALTHEDINRLIKEPSSKVRSEIAMKVAESYNESSLTANGNKIAIDIFRLLLQDTARHVRKTLAQALCQNPNAPRDIVLALAQDGHDIAEDILKHSRVLQEADLLQLVNVEASVKKLIAIAERKRVPERVSNALIGTGNQQVIVSLLANKGADVSESAYQLIINDYASEAPILEVLVGRGDLSYALGEKLYSLVADKLKKLMTRRYLLPKNLVDKVSAEVKENAILKFISPWMTDEDVVKLVDQMHGHRRLTNSIILRALCLGEIAFFEAAISKRVDIPLSNARKLLRDPGEAGFYAVYRSSRLPEQYREAVRVLLKLVHDEVRQNKHRQSGFSKYLARQIRQHNYDSSVTGMGFLVQFIEYPYESTLAA